MIHTYKYYIPQFTLVSVSSYITNLPLSPGNRENWRKPVEGDPTALWVNFEGTAVAGRPSRVF